MSRGFHASTASEYRPDSGLQVMRLASRLPGLSRANWFTHTTGPGDVAHRSPRLHARACVCAHTHTLTLASSYNFGSSRRGFRSIRALTRLAVNESPYSPANECPVAFVWPKHQRDKLGQEVKDLTRNVMAFCSRLPLRLSATRLLHLAP
jgi:hypothetical protein